MAKHEQTQTYHNGMSFFCYPEVRCDKITAMCLDKSETQLFVAFSQQEMLIRYKITSPNDHCIIEESLVVKNIINRKERTARTSFLINSIVDMQWAKDR
jgi:hypothetical protein